MSDPQPIDLRHLGHQRVIGAYLLDSPAGPTLFDCGPATTVETLRAELAVRGLAIADLRHLLLSHIHFDHAGAAGVLVRENPRLSVHVSAVGARRIYLDTFDTLWGELVPIPGESVRIVGERVLDFDCFPSPGHASHHVCYIRDGLLLAGDAVGVRIEPATGIIAPTPPPDIDIEAWEATLDEIERRNPDRLALTHFGLFDDVARHVAELRERLRHDSQLVERGATEAAFVVASRAHLGDDVDRFEHAVPAAQCYQGLTRYWERRRASNAG